MKYSEEDNETAQVKCSQPRHRSSYYVNNANIDPFPHPTLIGLPQKNQAEEVREAVEEILTNALGQGLTQARFDDQRKIVMAQLGVFFTDLSQSAVAITPLKLELKPYAKPVDVKIGNYSDSHRRFLRKLVGKLLDAGLIYPNPTSKWSCAPHLVPKPGPAELRLTVDLRPINRKAFGQLGHSTVAVKHVTQ